MIESEIARLLGDNSNATIRAIVTVTHTQVWGAVVRLEDDAVVLGQRTFEANSCEELRGAIALLIVLAVDPDAALAMPDSLEEGDVPGESPVAGDVELTSEVEVADESTLPIEIEDAQPDLQHAAVEDAANLGQPAPDIAESRQSDPQVRTRRVREVLESPHWGIAVRAGVDFGALPVPSPVFSVGAFHQRGRFGLGIYAFTALPQDASTAVDASGRLALGAIRATPGLHLRYGRLLLDLRGVVEVGVMAGRGRDVADPQTGYSLWAALGVEAGFSIRIAMISLGFRGDIRVPLNRPLYAFRGPLDVHRAASLVGRAEITLGLHFL